MCRLRRGKRHLGRGQKLATKRTIPCRQPLVKALRRLSQPELLRDQFSVLRWLAGDLPKCWRYTFEKCDVELKPQAMAMSVIA